MIVYLIENTANKKSYVGKTIKTMCARWRQHKNDARRGSKLPFHAAIRKYGVQAFDIKLVTHCLSKDEMNTVERNYIEVFETHISKGKGYNATWGGDGTEGGEKHPNFGRKAPMEERLKISKSRQGQKNPSYKARGLFHWNRGLVRSTETRKKISEKRALQDMSYKKREVCKRGHPRISENLTKKGMCKICKKLWVPTTAQRHEWYIRWKNKRGGAFR